MEMRFVLAEVPFFSKIKKSLVYQDITRVSRYSLKMITIGLNGSFRFLPEQNEFAGRHQCPLSETKFRLHVSATIDVIPISTLYAHYQPL